MIQIAPSILAADFASLGDEMQKVEVGGADLLHIDVMDGRFVPPITFGANMVEAAKKSCSLYREVHLMVVEPKLHIEAFAKAGSNRIIVHHEADPHLGDTLTAIRSLGVSPGATVNPETPIEALFSVLPLCDLVLIMTVNPGWGGQPFHEGCLQKIEKLRAEILRQKLQTKIEVDGGINAITGERCVRAGADILVAGTYIFNSSDYGMKIDSLRIS
jgi:ribulose-phosphate 3-epimerase